MKISHFTRYIASSVIWISINQHLSYGNATSKVRPTNLDNTWQLRVTFTLTITVEVNNILHVYCMYVSTIVQKGTGRVPIDGVQSGFTEKLRVCWHMYKMLVQILPKRSICKFHTLAVCTCICLHIHTVKLAQYLPLVLKGWWWWVESDLPIRQGKWVQRIARIWVQSRWGTTTADEEAG